MKVFIEKAAGLNQIKSDGATKVMRDYPYPYGYILDTKSGDGENVDCFVITNRKLQAGSTVDCEPVGLMEQIDDGGEDHKILAVFKDDPVAVDAKVKKY